MAHMGELIDMPEVSPRLTAALNFARRGWRVFPLKARDKTPVTRNGLYDATAEACILTDWWSGRDYNVGLPTGKVNGFIVLDLDNETAIDEAARLGLPPTWASQTSKGLHVFFRHPGQDVRNRVRLLAGMDIRADGGYIVAPPSIHPSGAVYRWDVSPDEIELADAPAWLLDLLTQEPPAHGEPLQALQTVTDLYTPPVKVAHDKGADALIEQALSEVQTAPEGARNDTLNRAAYTVGGLAAAQRVDPDEAARRLEAAGRAAGLTERETTATVASGLVAGMTSPLPSRDRPIDKPAPVIHFPAPATPDPWASYARTVKDFYAPRPPVTYAVTGLLSHQSLNVVYGAPGSLKSMILADLAVCVAGGLPWLPAWDASTPGRATVQSPVVWIDFDNGERRTLDRFAALCHARKLGDDTPITAYSMPSPWLDASNPVAIDALIRRIEAHAARLVVIDNLGSVKGSTDENTGDMGQVMAQFRRVAETTGAALVVIHHQRKSNGTGGRAGDALRGHSSIEAALDLALLVEREDRSETGTVKATKARGADVSPFTFYFTYDRDEAGELRAVRFFGIETDDADSDKAIDRAIFETVTAAHASQQAVNQSQLIERVKAVLEGVGVNRIRTRARLLADKGSILAIEGRTGTPTTYGPAQR